MNQNYMIFTVAAQHYAIAVTDIREILTYNGFTKLPDTNPWVVGIIETRGQPMPIIDLRIRFETQTSPLYTNKTIIIATKLPEGKLLGLIVDSVEEIESFPHSSILLSDGIDSHLNSRLIQGYIQTPRYSILLLDHTLFGELNGEPSVVNTDQREE